MITTKLLLFILFLLAAPSTALAENSNDTGGFNGTNWGGCQKVTLQTESGEEIKACVYKKDREKLKGLKQGESIKLMLVQ